MKWLLFILIILHGLFHLLGFLKAFHIAEINQLTQNISKPLGILWIVALVLFITGAIQFFRDYDLWWITTLAAVILSQILIIMFWQDAKFGIIINVVIILVSIAAFGDWNFNREVRNEIIDMFSKNSSMDREILTESMIKDLPYSVQKWLISSGAIGKEMIQSVRLKQKGKMRMKPEQDNWYATYAEQYFTVHRPALIWKTKVDIMPLVYFTGRDHFIDGIGKMLIKAFSLFNIVNAADEKINQGTMQRYVGELVWFPTAALSNYIIWEEIDSLSAKAIMKYKDVTSSGIFYFNSDGNFIKFSAMRYMGSGDEAVLKEWIITAKEYQVINGINIPVKLDVTWKLDSGDFKWFTIQVYDVEYNNAALWN